MATDYLSALNAGSGLNVTQIVDALVDAERVPKQKKIDEEKETATVQISALGSLKNELSVFQTNTAAVGWPNWTGPVIKHEQCDFEPDR